MFGDATRGQVPAYMQSVFQKEKKEHHGSMIDAMFSRTIKKKMDYPSYWPHLKINPHPKSGTLRS